MPRKKVIFAFMLFLLFPLTQVELGVRAEPRIIEVPLEYAEIQQAINRARAGDRILISSGTYYEHIVINKSISLIGEGATNTILDGNGTDTIIESLANDVTIIGLTVVNGGRKYYSGLEGDSGMFMSGSGNIIQGVKIVGGVWGMLLEYCYNTIIRSCIISNATMEGMYMEFCQNTTVDSNTFVSLGLVMDFCNGTLVQNNIFNEGMSITSCDNTTIRSNSFIVGAGLIDLHDSGNYLVYHNNFINFLWLPSVGTARVDGRLPDGNFWDYGYSSGGNYWDSDRAYRLASGEPVYKNVDLYSGPYQNETGSDGISDEQVVIRRIPKIADRYPLMKPWNSPTILVIFPLNGSEMRTAIVNVVWEVSNLSQIDHFEAQLDNGSWSNVGVNTSFSFDGLSDGSHTLKIKMISKLGIVQTEMISFTVNARYTKEFIFVVLPLTLVSIAVIFAFFHLRKTKKAKAVNHRIPKEREYSEDVSTEV